MKLFKSNIAIAFCLLTVSFFKANKVSAQQRPQFTQYVLNQYLINPALGGANKVWEVQSSFRTQWQGIEGSPTSFYISANGPLFPNKINARKGYFDKNGKGQTLVQAYHAGGINIISDKTGPVSRLTANLSYNYNMPISDRFRLSVGAFTGITQNSLNGDEILLDSDGNRAESLSSISPDLSLGAWIYDDRFFGGIVVQQVFFNDLSFISEAYDLEESARLTRQYYFTFGTRFEVQKFDIIPSVFVRLAQPQPISSDLTLKVRYDNLIWGGISYRTSNSINLLFGFSIFDRFNIGYSYDNPISDLSGLGFGSTHELYLNISLKDKKKLANVPAYW